MFLCNDYSYKKDGKHIISNIYMYSRNSVLCITSCKTVRGPYFLNLKGIM